MTANINYYQRKGSYQLKMIALGSAGVIVLVSLLFKYTGLYHGEFAIIPLLNILFCGALVTAIGSKEKIEDERTVMHRALSDNASFGMLIGFILLNQLDIVLGTEWQDFKILAYLNVALLFHQVYFYVNTYYPQHGFLKKGGSKMGRVTLAILVVIVFQTLVWSWY